MSYLPRAVVDILDEFNCDIDGVCKALVDQRNENEDLKGRVEDLESQLSECQNVMPDNPKEQ